MSQDDIGNGCIVQLHSVYYSAWSKYFNVIIIRYSCSRQNTAMNTLNSPGPLAAGGIGIMEHVLLQSELGKHAGY